MPNPSTLSEALVELERVTKQRDAFYGYYKAHREFQMRCFRANMEVSLRGWQFETELHYAENTARDAEKEL